MIKRRFYRFEHSDRDDPSGSSSSSSDSEVEGDPTDETEVEEEDEDDEVQEQEEGNIGSNVRERRSFLFFWTAYDVTLNDNSWSPDVFDVVSGNTSISWESLDVGAVLSHSFELEAKTKTVFYGTPALITFRIPTKAALQTLGETWFSIQIPNLKELIEKKLASSEGLDGIEELVSAGKKSHGLGWLLGRHDAKAFKKSNQDTTPTHSYVQELTKRIRQELVDEKDSAGILVTREKKALQLREKMALQLRKNMTLQLQEALALRCHPFVLLF